MIFFHSEIYTREHLKRHFFIFTIYMTKHKSTDYKKTAVLYYLNNKVSYTDVCKIFNCDIRSLKRWISKYQICKSLERKTKVNISYKVRKVHLNYAIKLLKKNEQITMKELCKMLKKHFEDFNITPQHLGRVLRDNNITRKGMEKRFYPNVNEEYIQ